MRGHHVEGRWTHDPGIYAPAKFRRACRYEAFVPDPVAHIAVQLPGDVAGVVSDAEAAVRALNARATPALQPLARLLLRTESIASSKVEGLQVDARTLARAEARADVGGSIGPTVVEVLANIDAMQLAVEDAATADSITPVHLVAIQQVLLQRSSNPQVAGRVRAEQNWIGGNDYNPCGAAFVPPPPDTVDALLDDLCLLANSEHLPPLVQAAIAHAQFETVHPFLDGNGRTGRALIHIILRRRGLAPAYVPPISVVLAAEKDRYIDGLTAFREDRVNEWIEQFATVAARAATLAERYLKHVEDLQANWRDSLRVTTNPRSDAAAWQLIDMLPGHPVITAPIAAAVSRRSKPAANQAIDQLVASGVLQPISESRRNRAWEAVGLLDLLADLESGR
jgi:Fic family protein